MGCCNSKTIYNDTGSDSPIKITFLGLPGVGKTSIVEYLAGEFDPKLRPITTQGVVMHNIVNNGENLIIYDCGGMRDREEDWNECIRKSNAICYVFDPLSIHHGYVFTKEMLKATSEEAKKRDIPILAVMLKTRNNGAIPRLKNLLTEFFPDRRIRLVIHPFINEEIDQSFAWLITESKRPVSS